MLEAPRLTRLRIQNLLSFGDKAPELDLKSLNVLIGPNASGKSNVIEVVGLLQSTPKDLAEAIREGAGIIEWIWKFSPKSQAGSVEALVTLPKERMPIKYRLSLSRLRQTDGYHGYQFEIEDERIENETPLPGHPKPFMFFGYDRGRPMISVKAPAEGDAPLPRHLQREDINRQQSVLSQRKDLDQYPELTRLGRFFEGIRLYRNWEFGRESKVRDSYGAEGRTDFLEEDASNLGLMLNRLRTDPAVKDRLLECLREFWADAKDIDTPIQGGFVDVRIEEEGKVSIPAIRLSDGTLRWLSLLTILLHPAPPPLVCLEEPELGLHPDVIRPLAKLLVEASERMQLIVTTHSDILVDELTETPEAVIVCEKHGGSTTMKRLNREELASWLKRYTLGELWHKGEIGGTRW